jgi:hypothetical protein
MSSPGGTFLAGLRLLLLLGGAILLIIPLARFSFRGVQPSLTGMQGRWATAALFVLGISEILGRALFYAVGPANPF